MSDYHHTPTPTSPTSGFDSSLRGKRGENRWRRLQPLLHDSGGRKTSIKTPTTTTYRFIRSGFQIPTRRICGGFWVSGPVVETAASPLPGPTIGRAQLASTKEAQMIWAGHQRGHIKERRRFKSSALTFMTSVYARSCTLTSTSWTFLSFPSVPLFFFFWVRVKGTYVSDSDVSCLGISRDFPLPFSSSSSASPQRSTFYWGIYFYFFPSRNPS